MPYTLITTGGTIDKVYGNGLGVRDLEIGEPVAPRILKEILHLPPANQISVCRKDSLDLGEHERGLICTMVKQARQNHVLITHGTDTLVQTAKSIKDLPDLGEKRVVLVGASQPACMRDSDALARIGFALGVLLASSEPTVIVAMDGIHTNLADCTKGEDGIFRSS